VEVEVPTYLMYSEVETLVIYPRQYRKARARTIKNLIVLLHIIYKPSLSIKIVEQINGS